MSESVSPNAAVRLISPDGKRKVDMPPWLARERLTQGWKPDPYPDRRGSLYGAMPGLHKGRPALVIASGPSSGLVDPDAVRRLIDETSPVVFATNDADRSMGGKPVPRLDYLVIIDGGLWDDRYHQLRALLAANPGSLPITGFDVQEEVDYIYTPVSALMDPNQIGPQNVDYEIGRLFHGWSSGVAAVQVAMWMGCGPIYLLGHDLQCAQDRTHGFGVREAGERSKNYPQRVNMFAGYETLAYHAAKIGVEVVNLSPCSALTYFPVRPLPLRPQ